MSEIPSMYELFRPCLELLAAGATNAKECAVGIQKRYGLSQDQMAELIPSGTRTRVVDRADWAIFRLMKAGLVVRPKRGVYELSPQGQAVARSGAHVDKNYLHALIAEREEGAGLAAVIEVDRVVESSLPPVETIEAAYQEISEALAEDLLEQVRTLTPARFERLIVELLLAMGYGDGRAEMGQAIGKSGDGGIDGVVNEDKLGLDAVYIQAKKYAPDNKVGASALRDFIGAITHKRASKGVFVATSSFTHDAQEFVKYAQQRIVLIDGARLARLMIDHGVGVRIDKTYVLRSIDANFFDVT